MNFPLHPKKALLVILLASLAIVVAWRFYPANETTTAVPAAFRDLTLSEAQEVQVNIGPGDFCAGVLERGGMDGREAARLIADVRPAYDLAKIRSGQVLTLFFENGLLRNLVYPIDRDRFLEAQRADGGGFRGRVADVPY